MILTYLIKSTLCFGILFGFYKVVLEHKAMHQFKRYYLLASLIFAFTIPLITFTYTAEALPESLPVIDTIAYYSNPIIKEEPLVTKPLSSLLPIVLWSMYGLGVLIFGSRFVLNLVRLKRKIDSSEKLQKEGFILSFLNQSIVPHSFLQWIFLNKTAYLQKEIAPEILAHEATHVSQKHSWDILIIEFLQIVFWFNPFIWMSKKSIKLNHEFLADQGAIKSNSNIAIYQNILLSYASSSNHAALESPFNYSLTKKRILMMSQTFSRKRAALSALLLLPIVALCLFLFNNEIKAQEKDPNNIKYAQNYIAGAQHNGEKGLVISINNNVVYLNGLKTSLKTFATDIDAYSQDWEETDFTAAYPSVLIKTENITFLEKLKTEFLKTHFSKANDGLGLIPPAPPAPVAPKRFENKSLQTPQIKKGDTITFTVSDTGQKAYAVMDNEKTGTVIEDKPKDAGLGKKDLDRYNELIKKYNSNLSSSKTFPNSDEQILVRLYQKMNKEQRAKNLPFPLASSKSIQQELEKAEKLSLQYTSQNPASKKEIALYNKLAKKYNKNPNGEIKKAEVARMYDIYNRMTPEQKKASQPYPALPPPPPPPPPSPLNTKNLPPDPPTPKKLKAGDTIKITVNDTGAEHQMIINENKKDTVKPKFKFQNVALNNNGVEYNPNLSVYPEKKFPETVDKISYKTRPSDGLRFFEGERELTPDEAMLKMNSADYFTDIGDVIPGTTKKKVVFTRKHWIGNDTNSQSNFKAIVTFENTPNRVTRLKNVIEQHALSKGLFEIEGKIISKEKALEIINQPKVGLEVIYLNTLPFKLILHKV